MSDGGSPLDAALIERLVREVLAGLNGVKNANEKPHAAQDEVGSPGELVLDGRVVTLKDLEGKIDNITRLVVPVRAVLTPAVQDLLRKNNVTLRRAEKPAASTPRRTIVVGVANKAGSVDRLLGNLARAGYGVEQVAKSGLASVVEELSDHVVRRGKLALLVSESAELALCLANRRRGVRAALGHDAAGVRRVAATVGANLLVVDPSGKSEATIERLAREFLEAKRTDCEELTRLLDGDEQGNCRCASQK